MKKLLLAPLLLIAATVLTAQEKLTIKFGNVTEKDFLPKVYAVDSSAGAVILADVGSSEIVGNNKGWFSLKFKKFRRVHVLNKNAFDIANVFIEYYKDFEDEEKLDRLKASTYNLENGKVVETKLDVKNSVFTEKLDKVSGFKKFTLPNVKEGSIFEFEYTIESDFLQYLRPWDFQGSYPRLWSEYNLALPNFLGYVFLTQGYRKYDIENRKDRTETFKVIESRGTSSSDFYNITSSVADHRWVMKEVPALKEEAFTTSINNHISRIEFQLSELREPLAYQKVMGSWKDVATKMLTWETFGSALGKDNAWLNDDVSSIVNKEDNRLMKAKKIFAFIRDNITCTDHSDLYMAQTIKNILKTKNGTVSEVNLLLTAMLRYADITADPVILSTRGNGYTYALYPLLKQYNYVVTKAVIDGKEIFLDASEPGLGFGHLPLHCYNGHARVISENPVPIDLVADSVTERKNTLAFLMTNDKGEILGTLTSKPGYYESNLLRKRIKENGKEKFSQDIAKTLGDAYKVSKVQVDSLSAYDEPVEIKYDFDIETNDEDIIYFSPMLGEGQKENPFKSAERFYPVEMPCKIDEIFTLHMDVPTGYVVDEIPKSVLVKLNEEGHGSFEYRVAHSGNSISLRTRVKIDRTFFLPEEYEMLREFYNLIVSKHAEQIVFKKKKG